MGNSLLSVGLDVGTTTTQLIFSRLTVENRAGSFAVPEMQITHRQIVYRGDVHFTPLLGHDRVDGDAIRTLVEGEYAKAGIRKEDVDTGAVIITGETSRKENAAAVLRALTGFAGEFVAATAGPDLESVLAAKGAGADAYSRDTGKTVLHMDIGGGTSNLALIRDGKILATGCMNVGGRLVKLEEGRVSYVSPVLQGLTDLRVGDAPAPGQLEDIAGLLVNALEMAAGLRPATPLFDKLLTRESARKWQPPQAVEVISFSGGVADCMETIRRPGEFGDMGVELGQAIGKSLLCRGKYRLGQETIRATVIGAGSHSARLSGSTVFFRGIDLPVRDLPVAVFTAGEQDSPELEKLIAQRIREKDSESVVLYFPGYPDGSYEKLTSLAQRILRGTAGKPIFVCLEADMAKALGQKLCLQLPEGAPCLCIDRVPLTGETYLDIGTPLGPALPIVLKTLILAQ